MNHVSCDEPVVDVPGVNLKCASLGTVAWKKPLGLSAIAVISTGSNR